MKEYLKLLIIMVTLVSIALLILPEGKMKKTTCIAFSFIITLTLLTPIKNFITSYSFSENTENYQLSLEYSYKNSIYDYAIKKLLKENGIAVLQVKCEFDEQDDTQIKKVGLKLDKSVLNENIEHINIIVKAKECLEKTLKKEISEVYIYE